MQRYLKLIEVHVKIEDMKMLKLFIVLSARNINIQSRSKHNYKFLTSLSEKYLFRRNINNILK